MKIETQFKKYKPVEGKFRCPICHGAAGFANVNSVVCEKGHCFDLSKKGYVNFIPGQKQTGYDRAMLEARRRTFESGIYDGLSDALASVAAETVKAAEAPVILDAGSGEGFFAGMIKERIPGAEIWCIDNSKDAITMGASKHGDIYWLSGDLTNIPLADCSADCIMSVFSPSNYSEFRRLLKDGGLLVKVVPAPDYLCEIRRAAGDLLRNREYSNDDVLGLFGENCKEVQSMRVTYKAPVSGSVLADLAEMTPLLFNVNKEDVDLTGIDSVTISVDILTGHF